MFSLFTRTNFTDRSVFQYARMDYLRDRVDENYQKLHAQRKHSTGRLDSNHLLRAILSGLAVEFKGDLGDYIQRCAAAEKRIVPGLGMSSSYSRGKLFVEGYFYPECPEIIISAPRYDWTLLDLWKDYRSLQPIRVLNHPITDLTICELSVMNEISYTRQPDLAIIAIDIPLLAAQWRMWRVENPEGLTERFLTEVPLVGALKSHLNVAFFNKIQVALGIKEQCKIRSNLTFAQMDLNDNAAGIVKDVVANISSKAMDANQILSTIPVLYGNNYLDACDFPEMASTFQVDWTCQASKMDPASVVLEAGRRAGFDRMVETITALRRQLIQNKEAKLLMNGLTSAAAFLLEERMQALVIDRLPA